MRTKKYPLKATSKSWNKLVKYHEKELRSGVSELEISALTTWVEDCHESFKKIYYNYLPRIKNFSPTDYGKLDTVLIDLNFDLQHIKNHIIDSEKALFELSILMGKKEEEIKK